MTSVINWMLGYFFLALFISVLDRYFSGEDYKKSEWINGRSVKFKVGLGVVVTIAPFFFTGVSGDALMVPFRVLGIVAGLYVGEAFLRSYDWAFKKPGEQAGEAPRMESPEKTVAGAIVDDVVARIEEKIGPVPPAAEEKKSAASDDDASRKSVVEAIAVAGADVKEGLKSLGEGIAKASDKLLGKDQKEKEEEEKKKGYEPNKKLDDKLNNY